jgi:N-succinyldiaminopimelate aminotransferase
MNSLLNHLQPYPFERLRLLFQGIQPNPQMSPISLGIGEPRHPTPHWLKEHLLSAFDALASYPPTAGDITLREACAKWLKSRYHLDLDPKDQILPITGSREGLFSIAQTVVNNSKINDPKADKPYVVLPNPFYQIYEGAAILAGATPHYVPSIPAQNFAMDWASVPAEVWRNTQLLYVCSPGNPTGAEVTLSEWEMLFHLSDQYGFVIASDECYSEIYFRSTPPLGSLEAAQKLGRHDFKNLLAFTSLSKRSNMPGLRSGFVAGQRELIKSFLLYRTYHGSAMSGMVQKASIAAWADEKHVQENRKLYQDKFAQVTPLLKTALEVNLPDAGFYLWAKLPTEDDESFTQKLYEQFNVTVLPGSYLAREVNHHNPGQGRIRMALVAQTDECLEAARRIVEFTKLNYSRSIKRL